MEATGTDHEGSTGHDEDFSFILLSCSLLYPLSQEWSLLLADTQSTFAK